MSEVIAPFSAFAPRTPRERILHPFEFHGNGAEFFRIWIVNLALTIVTLGIYSAWAKVRTRRYFLGNTFVAGHSFDYHASPLRILFGRLIALALFGGYNVSVRISPMFAIPWVLVFAVAIPWLIVSSQRFNARNTSYRNVRFNFTGEYWGALKAAVLWPLAGLVTLGGLMPLAHRAREYYYVNNHMFGDKHFQTSIPGKGIYLIYFYGLLILIGAALAVIVLAMFMGAASVFLTAAQEAAAGPASVVTPIVTGLFVAIAWMAVATYIWTKVFNLTLNHTILDNRQSFQSRMKPWPLIWIGLSNLFLTLITIGLFYPWARIRIARYKADHMSLIAISDLNEFSSKALATQSAAGEEIASFFDFDIGL